MRRALLSASSPLRSATSGRKTMVARPLSMASDVFTVPPNFEEDIYVMRSSHVLHIVFNRPKALNALNLSMVRKLTGILSAAENDPMLSCVFMNGVEEKAYCAGGDVKSLYSNGKAEDTRPLTHEFFREEYKLNYLLKTYQKPLVAILDGITMGGGVGLSVHGAFCVATERSVFAMPETAIGLFPDVGGSVFLPHLNGPKSALGRYLALTGARLKGRELLKAGIATHYVEDGTIPCLVRSMYDTTEGDFDQVSAVMDSYANDEDEHVSLDDKMDMIVDCFYVTPNGTRQENSLEAVVKRLEGYTRNRALADETLETLKKCSPTSLKVTNEQLLRGKDMSPEECFQMEYRLAQRFMEGEDFFEGVRAMLVDRDNAPKWSKANLSDVSEEYVDSYFQPFDDVERELELEVPDYSHVFVPKAIPHEEYRSRYTERLL